MSPRSLQNRKNSRFCEHSADYTEEWEETREINDEGCILVCVRVVKRQSEGKQWEEGKGKQWEEGKGAEGGKEFLPSYLRSEISISSRKKIGYTTPRDGVREQGDGDREGMK